MTKPRTTHDAMDAEVRRRLRLPLEQWEPVEGLSEFTSDARAYLDVIDTCKGGDGEMQDEASSRTLTRPDGTVSLEALLGALRLSKTVLEIVLGMSRDFLSKTSRLTAQASQCKLIVFVEILVLIVPWAGSIPQAFAWFTARPLPSFGGRTAADLVREGRADAVKSYASRIAQGGYA